jgi:RNA polymerase sigma-54 factor
MLKQQLQIKLSQKLSPQQIKLMKLIQLSTLDLEQKIEAEMGENPALETGKEETIADNLKRIMKEILPLKQMKLMWINI